MFTLARLLHEIRAEAKRLGTPHRLSEPPESVLEIEAIRDWQAQESQRIRAQGEVDKAALRIQVRIALGFAGATGLALVLALVAAWRWSVAGAAATAAAVPGLGAPDVASALRDAAEAAGSGWVWMAAALLVLVGAEVAGWALSERAEKAPKPPLSRRVRRALAAWKKKPAR